MYCRLARIVTLVWKRCFLSTNNTILSWYHKRKSIHTTRFHDTLYSLSMLQALCALQYLRSSLLHNLIIYHRTRSFQRMSAQLEFRRFSEFLDKISFNFFRQLLCGTSVARLPRVISRKRRIFSFITKCTLRCKDRIYELWL